MTVVPFSRTGSDETLQITGKIEPKKQAHNIAMEWNGVVRVVQQKWITECGTQREAVHNGNVNEANVTKIQWNIWNNGC